MSEEGQDIDPVVGNQPTDAESGPEGSLDWDDLQEDPSFVHSDEGLEGNQFYQFLQNRNKRQNVSRKMGC